MALLASHANQKPREVEFFIINARNVVNRFSDFFHRQFEKCPEAAKSYFNMLLMFLTMNNSKDLTNLVAKETTQFIARIG